MHKVAVMLTTARDGNVVDVDVHVSEVGALSSALMAYDREAFDINFIDDVDRTAARERFKRTLLRGQPVSIGLVFVRIIRDIEVKP